LVCSVATTTGRGTDHTCRTPLRLPLRLRRCGAEGPG
jgi:hypothetical protein